NFTHPSRGTPGAARRARAATRPFHEPTRRSPEAHARRGHARTRKTETQIRQALATFALGNRALYASGRHEGVETHAERSRQTRRYVHRRCRQAELDARQILIRNVRSLGHFTLCEPSLLTCALDGSAEGPAEGSFPHPSEARRKTRMRTLP